MRLWFLGLLLAASTVVAQPPSSLQKDVEAIVAQHHGKVAVYAENLTTHATVSIAPDTPVQTASVIKLAILYEALEQIRVGKLHFEDKIEMAAADRVPGSGILHLLDAPLTLTFKDVLTLMTMMSDNAGANMAMDHVGIANVNERMAKLGLANTYLYKKVFTPVAPGVVLPVDQKKFGLGKTTAREMAALMTKFVRCDLMEPGHPAQASDADLCKTALKMMQVQFYRSAIPRYLDGTTGATGDSIANKTGSLDAVRNDVGAVSTKSGMMILSIFTYENADHSWGVEQEGELTCAKVARAIVQSWSPGGLAPWPATNVKD
jgi:beta-lactamase class A